MRSRSFCFSLVFGTARIAQSAHGHLAAKQPAQIGDRPLIDRCDYICDGVLLRRLEEAFGNAVELCPRIAPVEWMRMKSVVVLPNSFQGLAACQLHFEDSRHVLGE